MSINEANAENNDQPLAFDPVTGAFNKPLEDEDAASEHDDFEIFKAFEDFEAIDVSEADYDAESVVDGESESESESESEIDPVGDVLANPDLLDHMVRREASARASSQELMGAINNQAQNIVRNRSSGAGMFANYFAAKIAGFRERRNTGSFEHKLSELDKVIKEITPWGFNPDSAESLDEAKEHFKTNGRGDIDKLEAAYKSVLDSGSKVANGYRSSSAEATSKLFQEEVLKKTAHFLKDNEKLLKCMQSKKGEDKTIFDDFKGGLGGLLDIAKMAFAKLALLLGAVGAARGLKEGQSAQDNASVMPLPRSAPPPNMPRMR